jgi:poly(3-hydroxybutyrate) depolymerase
MRMFSRITPAAAALSLWLATGPAAAEVLHVVTSQGAREAIVPPVQRTPAPTVIVLHGATATAERTAQASGFAEAAAAQGFVSAFPQGINRQWNDGREGHTSRANQCAGAETAPLPAQSSTASVHVTRLAWTSCRSGESVTLYRLEGGGHQVPGRPTLFPRLLGLSTQDIRAAETALAFLAR